MNTTIDGNTPSPLIENAFFRGSAEQRFGFGYLIDSKIQSWRNKRTRFLKFSRELLNPYSANKDFSKTSFGQDHGDFVGRMVGVVSVGRATLF